MKHENKFVLLKALFLMFAFISTMSILGQTLNVRGTISDIQGQSLIGVNVLEENTNNGTVTDVSGNFSLQVSSPQTHLVFSYIGYETQRVLVGN